MKKLFIFIAILFSINLKAQDTSYYYKRCEFYRCVRTKVTDTTIVNKYHFINTQKKKRTNRIVIILASTMFASLTTWYFVKP